MTERTDIDIEALKARLVAHRAELLEQCVATEHDRDTVELDQTTVGRLSRMDALQSQAMALETERRRELEIQRIDAALKRMEDEDYGYCLTCGEDIAAKRLDFDPSTPVCIDCAKTG
jgi:DnaK suppressor protein